MTSDTRTMQPLGRKRSDRSNAGLLLLSADPPGAAPPVVRLTRSTVAVGREPPPGDVQLALPSASRLHAKLVSVDDGWRIADLGSRNGTFVDGCLITESTQLRDGAEVRIGDAIFKFVADGVDAYAEYQAGIEAGARHHRATLPELIGGYRIDCVARSIEAVARTELSVLAFGETGTGKEIVARAVHRLSGRAGAFCAINCAAIPANLFESELFGVRKGAFTGADRDRDGIFAAADRGTLLLDEVGELPLEVQAKLLRVLEAREVRAVGATRPTPIDVRLVCATHRDLKDMAAQGRFRGDLLARLHGYEIVLPALRERKEDLLLLVRHFLERAGRPELRPTFPFMVALCDYDWPFNVRECDTVVRRAAAVASGPELDVMHLPEALRHRVETYGSRAMALESAAAPPRAPTADDLRARLARHEGNVSAVARELHKDPKQVHRWMRRYGISPVSFRR